MLTSIDFDAIKDIRRTNFEFLHEHLKKTNLFAVPLMNSFACPMVYPYLSDETSMRQRLIANKLFVATYWPNVKSWMADDGLERVFVDRLIPLPVDQRYGMAEMKTILSIIG